MTASDKGHPRIEASWLLIGCRDQLDGLDAAQLEKIDRILLATAAEQGWNLMTFQDHLDRRLKVVEQLNDAIGRKALGDLYIVKSLFAE